MTHIDDSLARGMAHAFLDHVAESDRIWATRRQQYRARAQLPCPDNLKNFHTTVQHMRKWTPERYRICEWSAQSGKKAVWCDARLTRQGHEHRDSLSIQLHEVTSTGEAGTMGVRITVTLHALQRMIQRSRLIRPPFDARALDPLYAEFNSLPLWLMPALYAARSLAPHEPARHSLLIPAAHGVFLACDGGDDGIVIKTYMGECHEMWSELTRALKALRCFDEQALGVFHGAVCHSEWGWEIDQTLVDELCRVWREWVWLNREREDRPKRDDRAWAAHRSAHPREVAA